jgi:hypothetical protein
VTWNIKTFGHGLHKNIPFLVQVLHSTDPDVIVIQEVTVDPAGAGVVRGFLASMERLGYQFVAAGASTGPVGGKEYPLVLYRRLWRGGWTATLPGGTPPIYWPVFGAAYREPWEVQFDLVKAGQAPRHVVVVHIHLANPDPQPVPVGQLNTLYLSIGPHLQV